MADRAGMQAGKVHRHFFCHLSLHHIQLDELWVNARQESCFPDNIAGGHWLHLHRPGAQRKRRCGTWAYPESVDCVRIAFFSSSLIGKMKIYLGKPVRVGDKKLTFAPFQFIRRGYELSINEKTSTEAPLELSCCCVSAFSPRCPPLTQCLQICSP